MLFNVPLASKISFAGLWRPQAAFETISKDRSADANFEARQIQVWVSENSQIWMLHFGTSASAYLVDQIEVGGTHWSTRVDFIRNLGVFYLICAIVLQEVLVQNWSGE